MRKTGLFLALGPVPCQGESINLVSLIPAEVLASFWVIRLSLSLALLLASALQRYLGLSARDGGAPQHLCVLLCPLPCSFSLFLLWLPIVCVQTHPLSNHMQ